MRNLIRVLHVLNELKPSGAETMLRSAASHWVANGYELHILATGTQLGPYAKDLAKAGYTIHHIKFSNWPTFLVRVWGLMRSLSVSVTHLHTERGNFRLGLLACFSDSRTVIRTVHSSFKRQGIRRLVRRVQRRILSRLGVRYVAISDGVGQVERARFGLHCITVPNWYNSDHFRPPYLDERAQARASLQIPTNCCVFTVIGNCSDVKNHPVLLHALCKLDSLVNWQLLHIGIEQPGYPERSLADNLGISDRIRFFGHQADVREFLWASDVFLMPSKVEGFSIAMLEAIACGIYVMAADVTGLSSMAAEFPGLPLVPNSAPAWTSALSEVLDRPACELQSLASNWSEKAALSYSIDCGARMYEHIYSGLVL